MSPGATVLSVGITRTIEGILGDVHPEVGTVAGKVSGATGGVGPDDPRDAADQHRRDQRAVGGGVTAVLSPAPRPTAFDLARERCQVMGIVNVTPEAAVSGTPDS